MENYDHITSDDLDAALLKHWPNLTVLLEEALEATMAAYTLKEDEKNG